MRAAQYTPTLQCPVRDMPYAKHDVPPLTPFKGPLLPSVLTMLCALSCAQLLWWSAVPSPPPVATSANDRKVDAAYSSTAAFLDRWPLRRFAASGTQARHMSPARVPAHPLTPPASPMVQVMAMVGGWAVFSLLKVASKPSAPAALKVLKPLLQSLVVSGGTAEMGVTDPAVLYLMARQRFGGLTAIKLPVLEWFTVTQHKLAAYLSQVMVVRYGAHAFQKGVDAVSLDTGTLLPARTPLQRAP